MDRIPRRFRGMRAVLARTLGVTAVVVGLVALTLPASGRIAANPQDIAARNLVGRVDDLYDFGLEDIDARRGSTAPTALQRSIVARLGANVTWNRFGTPQSLIKYGDYLATGLSGTPVQAARAWVRQNRALFALTEADVTSLELVNDSPIEDTPGHAVIFRQRFGDLFAGHDGLLTVGVTQGKVGYVSSSISGHRAVPAPATLTARAAWLRAAASAGQPLALADLSNLRQEDGWTVFSATGLDTPMRPSRNDRVDQRVRLVAVPDFTGGVRAAYEAIVLDLSGPRGTEAYTVFVDARTGQVLLRLNRVQQIAMGMPRSSFFSGETDDLEADDPEPDCGPRHDIEVDADNRTIDVVAQASGQDLVLVLYNALPADDPVASSDTPVGQSPEALHYDLPGGAGQVGMWGVRVCEFEEVAAFPYEGFWATTDTEAGGSDFPYPPRWNWFLANPLLGSAHPDPDGWPLPDDDSRSAGCWDADDASGVPLPAGTCDLIVDNGGSPGPWDHIVQTNSPSFTTLGNNADTAEAWNAFLTPGPFAQRPMDLDRTYGFDDNPPAPTSEAFTDSWNNNECNPAALTPPNNNADILASVTNLFAGHNRVHDWSYHLGFTEQNFNLQVNNFGNTAPGPFPNGREEDPEIGNAQNGASLPAALGLSRDNANQITLNDGIPGITNQFFFQPIVAAFYGPCADGDFDTSVYVHEYTHAISNRMAAGPDQGLTGAQAGAMGESWSDLAAVEYLNAHRYVPVSGENPWAVGAYATGNHESGIRNYATNKKPLNYGDVGYDIVGPQVHADGEIWSGVNYDLRQGLVAKYNADFPYSNEQLQQRCNNGILPADQCPGNRRWVQTMFDAWLLMASGSVSMLDARDAYLAADQMRYGGALPGDTNQKVLWREFARNGMGMCHLDPSDPCHAQGRSSFTTGAEDSEPVPSFETPVEKIEARIRFRARDGEKPAGMQDITNARIFVGPYEARITPIADTDAGDTVRTDTAFFVPGSYQFVIQADGYGLVRFAKNVTGSNTFSTRMTANVASVHNGATITGPGANLEHLIDDTENTTWDLVDQVGNVDVVNPEVVVDLAGDAQMVRKVRVSAMLIPGESRFRALRQFEIQTCDADTAAGGCLLPTDFTSVYTSADDTFPSVAPRPLAPDLIGREFNVTDTMATHVKFIVLHNQCTGAPDYQGDQEDDPLTGTTDCSEAGAPNNDVSVAELEVLSFDSATQPPADPIVAVTMVGPATARQLSTVTYEITYRNLGPATASGATLTDALPRELTFVSASHRGAYRTDSRSVVWRLGDVAAGATRTVRLVTRVKASVPDATVILNQATFTAPNTFGLPGAAVTLII